MNGNLLKISAHRHVNEYIFRENTFSQEMNFVFILELKTKIL